MCILISGKWERLRMLNRPCMLTTTLITHCCITLKDAIQNKNKLFNYRFNYYSEQTFSNKHIEKCIFFSLPCHSFYVSRIQKKRNSEKLLFYSHFAAHVFNFNKRTKQNTSDIIWNRIVLSFTPLSRDCSFECPLPSTCLIVAKQSMSALEIWHLFSSVFVCVWYYIF